MMPRRLAPALALLLVALPVRADFKDTYRKALEAVDRKRWADVAALMREAIAQNPKEGAAVKLYGMRFETYLPHFHLGYALSQLGQCDEAVRELEASESQGAVRSTPSYNLLMSAKAGCVRMAGGPPPPTRPVAPTPPPTTPAPVVTTTTLLPTTTTLRTLSVQPVASPTSRPTPPPTAPSLPPPTLARPGPPPPELVRAAEAYFGGRYDEAVSLLDRLTGLSGRPAAQVHLFRAAARFALYRIGGERDAVLRQRALQDVASCRGADPGLVPDPEAFPPPFAELFGGR